MLSATSGERKFGAPESSSALTQRQSNLCQRCHGGGRANMIKLDSESKAQERGLIRRNPLMHTDKILWLRRRDASLLPHCSRAAACASVSSACASAGQVDSITIYR